MSAFTLPEKIEQLTVSVAANTVGMLIHGSVYHYQPQAQQHI